MAAVVRLAVPALRVTNSGIVYEVQAQNVNGPIKETVLAVLVHGNGLCRAVYRQMIHHTFALNKSRQLYMLSIDLAGHGDSSQEFWQTRSKVSEFAVDIEQCVDDFLKTQERTVDRIVLVGHSIGAAMGMFAQKKRQLFHSALFLEPMLHFEFAPPYHLIEGTIRRKSLWADKESAFKQLRPRGIFSSWKEQCVKDYVDVGTKAAGDGTDVILSCPPACEAAIFRMDISEIYPHLPTLEFKKVVVIAGEDSAYLPPSFTAEIATKFAPPGEFALVEKAQHVPMCEQPEVVAEYFLRLLDGHKPVSCL